MEYEILAPNGPVLIKPVVHGDARGFFMETFRQNDFDAHCGPCTFVQDNHSKSRQHVLRGLHYQLRQPQGKLVRVIAGTVLDLAVDLRRSSPTFGQHFAAQLDAVQHHMFWVPPGFAHGFLVQSPEAEFVYKCTTYYAPDDEYCLRWDEPALGIDWPLGNTAPLISAKDQQGLSWADCPKYD